jgi:phage tail sheath gpL-like
LTVVATDTVAAIATSLAAAINAKTTLPVTASAATDTVTLTAKNLVLRVMGSTFA